MPITDDELVDGMCSAYDKIEDSGWPPAMRAVLAYVRPIIEREARVKALDKAAAICAGVNNYDNPMTANDCADAILALKDTPHA